MIRRRREPQWITRQQADYIHRDQLERHGGMDGLRDEGLLESALVRAVNRWHYEEAADLATMAADYAVGIAKNHPYIDGNKRTAFFVMATFLRKNGLRITAPQPIIISVMVGVGIGEVDADTLADWIRNNTARHRFVSDR